MNYEMIAVRLSRGRPGLIINDLLLAHQVRLRLIRMITNWTVLDTIINPRADTKSSPPGKLTTDLSNSQGKLNTPDVIPLYHI